MPKLLLVEDDNNLREIYQARLQAEGYTIVTAKDGEEALVIAKAEKPDLVVSDVMMPKISGFEMLDILRNTDGLRDVKVIMLTALGQSDDQARADKLGADRYLVKSQVTLEDIVKTAHELLQESGAEEAPAAAAPEAAPAPETAPVVPTTIPVASAPAEPAAAPAPVAAEAEVAAEAKPAAEEQATAEAEVESFVAGASSDAPAPTAQPTADDQVMADAASAINDASGSATTSPVTEDPVTVTESPAEENAAPTGGMKIIEPTESEPKKDINDLLAVEEAKEAAASQTPQTEVHETPPPAPQDLPGEGETPTDPSSIAL